MIDFINEELEKLQVSLNIFKDANDRLTEALERPKDEFIRDSVIKRFEFTIELAWKTLKKYLNYEGEESGGPRSVIEISFKKKMIDEPLLWGKLLTARNETSHGYSEENAEDIYDQIKEYKYLIDQLIEKLSQFIKKIHDS